MDQEDFDTINQYADRLSCKQAVLTDQDVTALFEIITKYSPEDAENVLYAYHFTIDMECMIHELQQIVLEDSKRNTTFRKQLLPLYKLFFVSLNLSRMDMFYEVCNVLLKHVSCAVPRGHEAPPEQLEFAFYDDPF